MQKMEAGIGENNIDSHGSENHRSILSVGQVIVHVRHPVGNPKRKV
jgi:hypothetical protein